MAGGLMEQHTYGASDYYLMETIRIMEEIISLKEEKCDDINEEKIKMLEAELHKLQQYKLINITN